MGTSGRHVILLIIFFYNEKVSSGVITSHQWAVSLQLQGEKPRKVVQPFCQGKNTSMSQSSCYFPVGAGCWWVKNIVWFWHHIAGFLSLAWSCKLHGFIVNSCLCIFMFICPCWCYSSIVVTFHYAVPATTVAVAVAAVTSTVTTTIGVHYRSLLPYFLAYIGIILQVILQHLDSRLCCVLDNIVWMLLIRRRVLVHLIMQLHNQQLISSTRSVDTTPSFQVSDREVIPLSDMHDLLNKIHYILDKSLAKKVTNASHILAIFFKFCFEATL